MANKKNFRNNPAMTFINAKDNTQGETQEQTQEVAQQPTQDITQQNTQEHAQEDTQEALKNVRTQGRKGHKKPRINLAFDNEDFLEKIRIRADNDGMSITQLVNEAVAHYLKCTKSRKGGK